MNLTHIDAKIEDIIIENRARQDFGDIDRLVQSIKDVGLLQPIVVTLEDGKMRLIDGQRRTMAFEKLGFNTIPAVYLRLGSDHLLAEYDANVVRKEFTPSEAVHLADKIKIFYENKAKLRQYNSWVRDGDHRCANLAQDPDKGKKTRNIVANAVGLSHETLKKATEIVKAAEDDPKHADLVEKMDQTGKVDPVYKELKQRITVGDNSYTGKELNNIARDAKDTIVSLIVKMPDGRQKKMGSIDSKWYQNRNILCFIIENVGLGVEEKDIVIHRDGNQVFVFDSDHIDELKKGIRYLVDRYSFTGSLMDAFVEDKKEETING
jgi:ParB/RepB/Spo0J family partition protein